MRGKFREADSDEYATDANSNAQPVTSNVGAPLGRGQQRPINDRQGSASWLTPLHHYSQEIHFVGVGRGLKPPPCMATASDQWSGTRNLTACVPAVRMKQPMPRAPVWTNQKDHPEPIGGGTAIAARTITKPSDTTV